MSGTDLYAGGHFTTAGGVPANYIAKWDGTAWSPLGSGVSGGSMAGTYALAVIGSIVYTGFYISEAGGVPVNCIAQWNGAAWSALGSGLGPQVGPQGPVMPCLTALTVNGTDLYVGGHFLTAGGVTANNIAKWDGTTWTALGSGVIITNNNTFTYVRALAADGLGHLFVGGSFTQAGTNVGPFIAQANVGPTAPFITRAPTNQNTWIGGEADFSVVARGTLPMGYQWLFGTDAIVGATNSTLHLTNLQPWQTGSYTVLVTNAYGAATSAPAVLTVLQPIPPTIVTGPSSQAVSIGATVDFSVAATGSPPPSYYWFFNVTNAQGTGATLRLTDVRLAQAGAYTVIVSNLGGAVASAPAWLTVTGIPPSIVSSPTNRNTVIGGEADFSVVTGGTLPMSYQWFFGTGAILGSTNAALQLINVQPWQAGAYTVVVTNAYGATTSAPAVLQFLPPHTVLTASEAALRAAMAGGGTVTFACDGTITLANTLTITLDTVLDATGHQVTISGTDAVRVFYVQPKVTLVLNHLTIAHGRGTNGVMGFNGTGAGLFNDNGTVSATNTVFYSNLVVAPWLAESAAGGALANYGVVNLANCSFTSNSVVGGAGMEGNFDAAGGPGGNGAGGAVWNSGLLTVLGCTFAGNRADGGAGGYGGEATWEGERGGPGGPGGDASGGALFNGGVARLVNCTLANNTGAGGAGGPGGAWPFLRTTKARMARRARALARSMTPPANAT